MKYNSVFEIIGPVMVGPSSSHTAGAVRIGNIAYQLLGHAPRTVRFELAGSFAETYQGHGTDMALIAGVMGLPPDSDQVSTAKQLAMQQDVKFEFGKVVLEMYHPNTVRITASDESESVNFIASSLGGGKVEVQELFGLPLKFTGDQPTLILFHDDRKGFLACVSNLLDKQGYNIARLALERYRKGGEAITVCVVDQPVAERDLKSLQETITALKHVKVVHVD